MILAYSSALKTADDFDTFLTTEIEGSAMPESEKDHQELQHSCDVEAKGEPVGIIRNAGIDSVTRKILFVRREY